MEIKEIMNKAVAVDHDITLREAADIMSHKNIGSLVVVKGEIIIGIITEKDIVNNACNLGKKLFSIMPKKVITIKSNCEMDDAAMLMRKNKIRRLPVLEGKKLVGIITSTDLIAHSDDLNEDFLFN